MKTTNQRQKEHQEKMKSLGFKRTTFYITDATLKAIVKYKEKHGLSNMNDAINQMIAEIK